MGDRNTNKEKADWQGTDRETQRQRGRAKERQKAKEEGETLRYRFTADRGVFC